MSCPILRFCMGRGLLLDRWSLDYFTKNPKDLLFVFLLKEQEPFLRVVTKSKVLRFLLNKIEDFAK